jgi:hypothetical protein
MTPPHEFTDATCVNAWVVGLGALRQTGLPSGSDRTNHTDPSFSTFREYAPAAQSSKNPGDVARVPLGDYLT